MEVYLIRVRPEYWNCKLALDPAFSNSSRYVPHWVTTRASIHLQAVRTHKHTHLWSFSTGKIIIPCWGFLKMSISSVIVTLQTFSSTPNLLWQHPVFPRCHAHLPNTYLYIDIEGSRAGAIMAGQRIQEVDAVCVVLLHGGHVEVCHLARCSSRSVDQHEGTYDQHKIRNKSGYNLTCANDITTASRDNVTRFCLYILSSWVVVVVVVLVVVVVVVLVVIIIRLSDFHHKT